MVLYDQTKWTNRRKRNVRHVLTASTTIGCIFGSTVLTQAYLSPSPTPRMSHTIQDATSTLLTDTSVLVSTVSPVPFDELDVRGTFVSRSKMKSFADGGVTVRLEKPYGQRLSRVSHSNRYTGLITEPNGLFPMRRPTTNNHRILGFDVGLRMMEVDMAAGTGTPMNYLNSPLKKQVFTSLPFDNPLRPILPTIANTDDGSLTETTSQNDRTASGTKEDTSRRNVDMERTNTDVPAWFPRIPTRSQILTLKLKELKGVCAERGLRLSGKKADLQDRLLSWTREQHNIRLGRNVATHNKSDSQETIGEYNLDTIDPLIRKRKDLLAGNDSYNDEVGMTRRRGMLGFDTTDPSTDRSSSTLDTASATTESFSSSKAYISQLTRTFHHSSDQIASSNNYQIKQLFLQAKQADQNGDLSSARRYLTQLRAITKDNDTRVLRRLSRLEYQCGRVQEARAILQSGLRARGTDDAYLLQGLGNLDKKMGDIAQAREHYQRAVKVAPKGYANPYHALGTLEHSMGNIKAASKVLREGLTKCPRNHRLHHALGDLYREAKMLGLAETEYKKGLKCIEVEGKAEGGRVKTWGRSFFYTALGYLDYEREMPDDCRGWLERSIDDEVGNVMHAQGWLALAELEESLGNFDVARNVYENAVENYEKKRRIIWPVSSRNRKLRNSSSIVPAKIGDQWLPLYNSWIRMEESQSASYQDLNNLYSRAAVAFPNDWRNLLRWAKFQMRHKQMDRARTLFDLSCELAGSSDAEPYRQYAEFEMSRKNYNNARSILFLGAQVVTQSSDGLMGKSDELSKLYHAWGVCEWHLGDLDRAETLFDHALRLTGAGEDGTEFRMLIFYSIARFLFYAREDYVLAQHYVCLSLSETAIGSLHGKSRIWTLWADIATAMDKTSLAKHCEYQAKIAQVDENTSGHTTILSIEDQSFHKFVPHAVGLLRKAPWHHKIIHEKEVDSISWYNGITFPETSSKKDFSQVTKLIR